MQNNVVTVAKVSDLRTNDRGFEACQLHYSILAYKNEVTRVLVSKTPGC